jgi:hypothetical protein
LSADNMKLARTVDTKQRSLYPTHTKEPPKTQ